MTMTHQPINSKLAAVWGVISSLPFLFSLTVAITGAEPFHSMVAQNHKATAFGAFIFHVGLLGLPLALLASLLSMLSMKLEFLRWSVEGKISFHPKLINLIIGVISLLLISVFGGHLVIDAIACINGNLPACD